MFNKPIVRNNYKPIIDKKNNLASSNCYIPAQKADVGNSSNLNGVAISNSQKLDEPEPMDWWYTPHVREIVVKNKPLIKYNGFFKQNEVNKDKFDEPEPMDWCYTPYVREIVVKNKPLIEYNGFFKQNEVNKDKFDEPEPMDWCYTPEIVVKNKSLI